MSDKPLLRPEEVQRVLSPDGAAQPARPPAPDGPIPYSLREPVVIPPDGEAEARRRVEAVIESFQQVLRRELESELSFAVQGFRQQRAADALGAVPPPAWVLAFVHAEGGGLALVLHPSTALALVELALGGFGNQPETARLPTPLETRVMTKLATTLAPTLGHAVGEALTSGTLEVGELPASFATPGEMVGAALVQVKIAEGEQTSMLLVSTRLLNVGQPEDAGRAPLSIGPLAARLGRLEVDVRPVLRAGDVGLDDLTALRPGAVLQLDVSADALLQLRVCGQTTFAGRIVREPAGAVFAVKWRRGPARRAAKKPKETS